MIHSSVRLDTPIEFINITPLNPLISKCQIKVCYVGEEPNRNGSIITKEVARQMANSLPGNPIVGLYNPDTEDFEEHSRMIEIEDNKLILKDITRPYGFVDLNAKVWFQKFLDDGQFEREYLMTEGYLWTGQYPECQRIIDKGNNHSMELDEKTLSGTWTKSDKNVPEFFIINEAILSKLCILGEDFEPCFEGSQVTKPTIEFSFEEGFKEKLFSMMNELKDLLSKGGTKVFTRYNVEIGDALWTALYNHVENTYDKYSIEAVCEEGEQKFAVLNSDNKYYCLNFSVAENDEVTFATELSEIENYSADEPQFSASDIEAYAKKKKEEEEKKKVAEKTKDDKDPEKDDKDEDPKSEDDDDEDDEEKKKKKKQYSEDVCPKCGKPEGECKCDKEAKKYCLDEIVEYTELKAQYDNLQAQFNELKTANENLEAQIAPLAAFKAAAEKKEKEAMIESFYMLSDDDKKDVIDNIDTYSVDDIEAKLSIICVRNKVSFNLDDDKNAQGPTSFSLNGAGADDNSIPAWVKQALKVAETMN